MFPCQFAGSIDGNANSFYFASNLLTTLLPVTVSFFTGERAGDAIVLNWQANGDGQVIFGIERSVNAVNFANIGQVNSTAEYSFPYIFRDRYPDLTAQYDYYRLSITEDGKPSVIQRSLPLPAMKTGDCRLL
jgi:hypothetical protein